MSATTQAVLFGYLKTALGIPGMVIPLFRAGKRVVIQECGKDGILQSFVEVLAPNAHNLILEPNHRTALIGGPLLFAIALDATTVIAGSQDEIAQSISLNDPRLVSFPHLRADIAEFIGDKESHQKALEDAKVDGQGASKLPASFEAVKQRRHGSRHTGASSSPSHDEGQSKRLERYIGRSKVSKPSFIGQKLVKHFSKTTPTVQTGKVYHVTQNTDGSWKATLAGSSRASILGEKKADVVARTIALAKNSPLAEVIVHSEQSQGNSIQSKRTFGTSRGSTQ